MHELRKLHIDDQHYIIFAQLLIKQKLKNNEFTIRYYSVNLK
jgi:hypothetical protein